MIQTWVKGVALLVAVAVAGCAGPDRGTISSTGTGGSTVSTLCSDPGNTGQGTFEGGSGRISTGTGGGSSMQPTFGPTMKAAVPPPAISGGTLRILPDGHTAVAADPDRDQVYVVDLTKRVVTATFKLSPGDEPGRVVIDGVGRAHVALRGGGALVSFDPRLAPSGQTLSRRDVCAAPRGVAYDKGMDLVHVACSDGQLVSLPAAGGAAVRTVTLDRDLRDVVVDGARLKVSRFRTAEILTVEADGTVSGRTSPPTFQAVQARNAQRFTPGIAYKMEALPSGDGVLMVHQRGLMDAIDPVVGGYGGFDTCQTIVHPAVTMVHSDGTVKSGPALAGLVLAVDMAVSHDGARVALVSAGNANNHSPDGVSSALPRVFLTTLEAVTDDQIGCQTDGVHAPCPTFLGGRVAGPPIINEGTGNEGGGIDAGVPDTGVGGMGGGSMDGGPTSIADAGLTRSMDAGPVVSTDGSTGGTAGRAGSTGTGASCGQPDPSVPQVAAMQPIAVAFDGQDNVVVQSREPALLALPGGITISLSSVSRSDTGHDVFHANAGGSLACASCHAEGNDDGRVWNFTCSGNRRTQSLQTGLRGTEPFHWSGDETDFPRLMKDVFVGRMSGPSLASDQSDALLSWIDAQPLPKRTAGADTGAVARGKVLFEDTARAGCITCHNGPKLTNAQTVDVGTGAPFQVPSLVGVGTRGPYMHDGCARTMGERFTNPACGGGDKHGHTSVLTPDELSDLLAFLNSV